ncbi:NAD(P)-binding domain-containing protein [Ilumatobacter nonamiensis]|uniref:NAD(P)-binding domain-containing protein n=1 Tax=Ilumatobacter nonamiensis TaxID=467093 RepID=UPI00034B1C54|nr:NAD(P)-binding domain-containing protein [Ilumatobacter nonamiensis]
MADTTTVIIGAGHAGLAMSRRLTERSIDHVVLERGEVAHSWRTERWNSLRLLTPNWHSRLPGMGDCDADPDGFMSMSEVVALLAEYAEAISAPLHDRTTVTRVSAAGTGYDVVTDQGVWRAPTVVLASGSSNIADVPAMAQRVPRSVTMCTPLTYRSPDDLDERGVLVVGASATGIQLADEIQRSGRPVTIAVGEHVRLPRSYRGRDIFWWMDASGILDQRYDEVDDLVRARHLPSPQLIGHPDRRSLDLNALAATGVRVVGRLAGIDRGTAQFSGALANVCALADLKMNRLLDSFDDWARRTGDVDADAPERFAPTCVSARPTLGIDLGDGHIGTVIWCTGYRPDYRWLDVPVLDRRGRIRHAGGAVVDAPGMYLLGANLLRRRRSSYIGGAASDTADLAAHLHHHLGRNRESTAALIRS